MILVGSVYVSGNVYVVEIGRESHRVEMGREGKRLDIKLDMISKDIYSPNYKILNLTGK